MNIKKNEQFNYKCIGCENCVNSCPRKAIVMAENSEGFEYPEVNDNLCINCGVCVSVCPMYQDLQVSTDIKKSYATITTNKKIYSNAASGGTFGTLAIGFMSFFKGSSVIGASFKTDRVEHVLVDKIDEIVQLQNSKYVQSKLGNIFITIKRQLEEGNKVLFSGTPCQVNALRLFLKENDKNLYTVDLICHGVPSPKFLKKDLRLYGDKCVLDIGFRLKNKGKRSYSGFVLSIRHKKYVSRVLSSRDPYYSLFMSGDTYREACYQCPFACISRSGDITIGDCDSHNEFDDFHPGEAINTLLINTNKGLEFWNMVKENFEYCELDLDKESSKNTQLRYPVKRKKIRNEIYKIIEEMEPEEIKSRFSKKRDWKEFVMLLKMGYLRR